jgi:hypothetical protein
LSGTNTVLSFPTQTGFTYLVVYKNNLEDANWKLLSVVPGDGTTKILTDAITEPRRFYKLVI